jgi:signal recognition particle subunit SRP54
MFETLGNKLQDILEKLKRESKLTEPQVKAAMREIRMALLEADVNFSVARDFVARVSEKAVGAEVLGSLTAGQQVVKVVHDELIETLGGKAQQPTLKNEGNVMFMVGLQGAGKTTSTGKLAKFYKDKGRRVLLIAADTQRPAAREQLKVLGAQVGVPVMEVANGETPQQTAAKLREYQQTDFRDLVIVDTAGRLQIDETLMDALADLKTAMQPTETLLVVDAMTGQEALNVAKTFDERISLSGLIITKMDGDARGGAALSARFVTGKPIYFAGTSEKLTGLEPFYPDRVAGRILGMGDVLGLIERAQQADMAQMDMKKPGDFDLEDLLTQLRQIRKMGPLGDLLKMIPGMGRALPEGFSVDEKEIQKIDALISSMTLKERRNPAILNASRRKRIAGGSGSSVQEINRLIKMHEQMKGMMKMLSGLQGGGKGGKMPRLPGKMPQMPPGMGGFPKK